LCRGLVRRRCKTDGLAVCLPTTTTTSTTSTTTSTTLPLVLTIYDVQQEPLGLDHLRETQHDGYRLKVQVRLDSPIEGVQVFPTYFSIHTDDADYFPERETFLLPGGCAGESVPKGGERSCWLQFVLPVLAQVETLTFNDPTFSVSVPLSVPNTPSLGLSLIRQTLSPGGLTVFLLRMTSYQGAAAELGNLGHFSLRTSDGRDAGLGRVCDLGGLCVVNLWLPPDGSLDFQLYVVRTVAITLGTIEFVGFDYTATLDLGEPVPESPHVSLVLRDVCDALNGPFVSVHVTMFSFGGAQISDIRPGFPYRICQNGTWRETRFGACDSVGVTLPPEGDVTFTILVPIGDSTPVDSLAYDDGTFSAGLVRAGGVGGCDF